MYISLEKELSSHSLPRSVLITCFFWPQQMSNPMKKNSNITLESAFISLSKH